MTAQVLLLPGDGIGPEIVTEARRVLEFLITHAGLDVEMEEAPIGGAAIDLTDEPLPLSTLRLAGDSDAVLLGSVGGPAWDALPPEQRPEKGLLGLRAGLGLYANLRPAILYPQLAGASSLKPELVAGLDLMIVRELTGGIYFGEPRGVRTLSDGARQGYNTLVYSDWEVERIGRIAFETARKRGGRLCSVDKANVLEATRLWREVITGLAYEYPDIELEHMYVDNAAMQLIKTPKQFDVIVTTNMFGDILSDAAAMLTGSIGMLPSASLNAEGVGMYEPIHGSAPDIAGQGIANPLATILSVAMMLRYSLGHEDMAVAIESAVDKVLDQGYRTPDIHTPDTREVGTAAMGDAVLEALANP